MFVTLEGIEGSGKSTLLSGLAQRLEAGGAQPLVTYEPGGTPAGDAVRELLLNSDLEIAPLTEALLMNAARAQLVTGRIRPALAARRIVLCDRYFDSTLAYQGYGRGLDIPTLRLLCLAATSGLDPDLTFLLDLPVESARGRLQERAADRIEREDGAFFERARRGYLEMAKAGGRWHVLDAMRSPEELLDDAWPIVRALVEAPA
ncbi:MAG TPA: dTMP kinase [Candidatus Dormibacteraeota bacterium]|nr:dTMP kinase [Candidatus Dormibacteraeota bacterium]